MRRDGDELTAAIAAKDLSKLIAAHYPDSRVDVGKPGVYFASWRGNTNTPALSLSKKQGVWLWHDMATGEGGNAFDFMVNIMGMGRQEAAIGLLSEAGYRPGEPREGGSASKSRPLPPEAVTAFSQPEIVPIAAMKGRGFNKRMLETYRIIPAPDRPDDALIPITSPEGVILQVKRRIHNAQKGKYRYEHEGYGGPPWCSPGSRKPNVLYVIEGELNAIVAHASLLEAGERIGVMGVAGAKNSLYEGLCMGKSVFIYADDDKAGKEAMDAWSEEARKQGARSVHRLPPLPMDFCDYAAQHGREALAAKLREMHHFSIQVFGAMDRMVGSYTVRELAKSAARYISGEVINPLGIGAIDYETGGMGESGVIAIGALPSIGKSALLRKALLEHVRMGGTTRLYSPDQSTHAIYRLLASLLSDVGTKEARQRNFSRAVLDRYGDPEAAIKAWKDAYEYVVMELSSRFQVSEESDLTEIGKDMERARDQGVTMFGGDYLQLFEMGASSQWEGNSEEGAVAQRFKRLTRNLGVLFVCAVQLAKYKFPMTRKSGIPFPSDIEGSGKTWQAAEMAFGIYNDSIYGRMYAGPDTDLIGDPPDIARLYLWKHKEGDPGLEFNVLWHGRIAAFKDPKRPKLEHEREGLM